MHYIDIEMFMYLRIMKLYVHNLATNLKGSDIR